MTSPLRADARVVLIAGAGGGIGRAAARAFAREGASIALMGRRLEALQSVAREMGASADSVAIFAGDVTNEASVRGVVAGCLERFGAVETLVNCAGIAAPAALTHDTADESWNDVLAVNLTGTFRMIRAVLPLMLAERHGSIVNVASIAGLVGMEAMAAYGGAKGGVIALTRAVAVEYGAHGIRCNCVCPGTVETPMTEGALARPGVRSASASGTVLGRIARPEEIAEVILHLGTAESSFLTGAIIPVDGGYTAK